MVTVTVLLLSLLLPLAAPAGVLHPDQVLAGALAIPLFYEREGGHEGTPYLVARAGERAMRLPFAEVDTALSPPSFLVFVEDPLLFQTPGEAVALAIEEGDTVVWRGEILVRSGFGGPDLVTVEEGGELLLWESDRGDEVVKRLVFQRRQAQTLPNPLDHRSVPVRTGISILA